ncbi:hypothetical protein MTO96_046110 [Rhipicephalus appendiculatus]
MRHFVRRGCPLRDTLGAPGVPVQDGHPMNSLPGKGGARLREEAAAPFELAPAYRALIAAADLSLNVSDARGLFYPLPLRKRRRARFLGSTHDSYGAAGIHAYSSSWKGRKHVSLRSHEQYGENALGSNGEINAWNQLRRPRNS